MAPARRKPQPQGQDSAADVKAAIKRVQGQKSKFSVTRRKWFIGFCTFFLVFSLYMRFKAKTGDLTDPYVAADLPRKGKGLLATRDIKQGELIIRESPLFAIPSRINTNPQMLLSSLLSKLTPSQHSTFYSLSHVPPVLADPKDLPLAIVQTNAISAGPSRIGVFPTVARMNHACAGSFNAVYSWREEPGEIRVYAIKDVNKGEEILTTYMDTKQPRQARQSHLLSHYHFNCTCPTCSLPPTLSAKSDARLTRMSELYRQFSKWGQGQKEGEREEGVLEGDEAVRLAKEIWKVGEEEGYASERGRLAGDVVWVALAHSDADAAREWAQLAERWFGIELGADSVQVREMRAVLEDPESHRAWGTRRKMKVGGPGEIVA